mgnify:CR=1 FL=1
MRCLGQLPARDVEEHRHQYADVDHPAEGIAALQEQVSVVLGEEEKHPHQAYAADKHHIDDSRCERMPQGTQYARQNLVEGMDAKEAISRMGGIRCGFKNTSCPDQLAKALRIAKEEQATAANA